MLIYLVVFLFAVWLGVRWGAWRERQAASRRGLTSFADGVGFGIDLAHRSLIDATSHLTDDYEHFQIIAVSDAEAAAKLIALTKDRPV